MKDFLNHWFAKIEINYAKKRMLLQKYKNLEKIWNLRINEIENDNSFLDKMDIELIIDSKKSDQLIEEVTIMKENNIHNINELEDLYPIKLRMISSAPPILYYKGNIAICNEKSAGVIGTRNPSEYGKRTSKDIAAFLSNNDIVVISGMAYGIDTYAHIGALNGKSNKTIAVLGNGLLEEDIYPKANVKLFNSIVESGGLIISEYPIYTKAQKQHFPARNRLIAALSDKIIVVEAGIKSGTFITVDFALDYGKDIYAVPGGVYSSKSMGCNQLIKEGANMLCKLTDIL